MKSLIVALWDPCTAVRETVAGIIGRIGLPEAMSAIDELVYICEK